MTFLPESCAFCNAGHNPPILIHPDGSVAFMPVKNNLFIGVMKNFDYKEEEITLTSGTKLFLYMDGVTEAENMEHALYSEERLLDILAAHAALKVQALVDMVMKSVRDYAGEATQSDGMTMLAIHYKPKSKDNGKRENIEQ